MITFMSRRVIAYYPGETLLHTGAVSVQALPSEKLDPSMSRVTVEDEPNIAFTLVSKTERPIRTVHTAYFSRHSEVIVCNVDLELPEQPSLETVAQAILAEQDAGSTA
jgi:hypothetical protein